MTFYSQVNLFLANQKEQYCFDVQEVYAMLGNQYEQNCKLQRAMRGMKAKEIGWKKTSDFRLPRDHPP